MLSISCLRGILWTGGFADPGTALDVLEGIEQFMEKEGILGIFIRIEGRKENLGKILGSIARYDNII